MLGDDGSLVALLNISEEIYYLPWIDRRSCMLLHKKPSKECTGQTLSVSQLIVQALRCTYSIFIYSAVASKPFGPWPLAS